MRMSICLLASFLLVSSSSSAWADEVPQTTTPTPTTNGTTVEPVKTTTSTTPAPAPQTSTVTPAPVPTPAPTPSNEPNVNNYNLTSETNKTCLMASFALQFVISYENTNKTNVTATLPVVNGTMDLSKSSCGDNATQTLAINFKRENANDSVLLHFRQDKGDRYLHQIVLSYHADPETFPLYPGSPSEAHSVTITNQTLFSVKEKKSYRCNAETRVTLDGVTVAFDHVKLDVFLENGDARNEEMVCASDDNVNDLVPIAVGCALLALVVIVLIAYFIGRRRTRRLAYQSV